MDLTLIFLIIAIVLFILAGIGIRVEKASLGWIGLAFFAASFLPL